MVADCPKVWESRFPETVNGESLIVWVPRSAESERQTLS